MALIIKDSFVKEDIVDEKGNKIGEIKFNPNDSRIMSKLTSIVNDLSNDIKQLKNIGEIPNISDNNLTDTTDFEKVSDAFKVIEKGFNIEEAAADSVLNKLSDVFGKETIDIFTGGTKDILSVIPLIEYILPYVKKARETRINKYMNKTQNGVMK